MTAFSPRWRRRSAGPLGPHGETAERLAALYAGVETQPLPAEFEALLLRLDEAQAPSCLAGARLSRSD